MNQSMNLEFKHFSLHPCAEGVFAAIARDGGAAICNSGIIDLGGQVVLFDTFMTPQAAKELQQAAWQISGRCPTTVINSHYHNDHIWGNQVFAPQAPIVSSSRTRKLIETEGAKELQWYQEHSAEKLAALQAEYRAAGSEEQQQMLLWLGYYAGLVEALPDLSVCPPSITFEERLELHGSRRSAWLIAFENGHSPGDTLLFLPQEKIVFMSDLLFTNFHPYLADGDPWLLLKALGEISKLGAEQFVPGHGPLGTAAELELMIAYVEEGLETARRLIENGQVSEEILAALPVSERFAHWRLPNYYRSNIRFLCKYLGTPR